MVLICIFLMTNDAEYLFNVLISHPHIFGEATGFKSFTHFLN